MKKRAILIIVLITIVLIGATGAGVYYVPELRALVCGQGILRDSPAYKKPVAGRTAADWIVIGAKEEVISRVTYDAAYQRIGYPMGDVSAKVGACTDVVIRALRKAGYDLQELIYEDIKIARSVYQKQAGLKKTDTNIDHRRIPNQMVFMRRYAQSLPIEYTTETRSSWQPGDIVYWKLSGGRKHAGVISDKTNRFGRPLVMHNYFVTAEKDVLQKWEIIGHFRYPRKR